jgi:hypothetical protein
MTFQGTSAYSHGTQLGKGGRRPREEICGRQSPQDCGNASEENGAGSEEKGDTERPEEPLRKRDFRRNETFFGEKRIDQGEQGRRKDGESRSSDQGSGVSKGTTLPSSPKGNGASDQPSVNAERNEREVRFETRLSVVRNCLVDPAELYCSMGGSTGVERSNEQPEVEPGDKEQEAPG